MTWTHHQLNNILDLGDEMYRIIPHIHKYIDYPMLPWLFCISQYKAIFESGATVVIWELKKVHAIYTHLKMLWPQLL